MIDIAAKKYENHLDAADHIYSVIVIGAGQAGLSMSYCLKEKGLDHLVLEKAGQIADVWRNQRWDSFCLVTPNWQCQLPGFNYTASEFSGSDPNGFMLKDEIIAYLERYVDMFSPPIIFNSPVNKLSQKNGYFLVDSNGRSYKARQVVVACGSYHEPFRLDCAGAMPSHIEHIHSRD